jgi:DNA-binding NtrC family response regulator
VECIKAGAYDFILKPVNENRLLVTVKNLIKLKEIQKENLGLKRRFDSVSLEKPAAFEEIITRNNKMTALFQYIEAIAGTSLPILITGETGTGKELLARAVHKASGRKGKFTALNIAGEDKAVVSDTLFGHSKGGFTGAVEARKGLIETAAGGTLFLDEIGDLGGEVQTKLLRLLQEKKYYPIGSDSEKTTDARFVFATNREPVQLMEEKQFRKDLYYRLQSHHIHLPPLRERLDDIPLLLDHFLTKAAKMMGKKEPTPPEELGTLLQSYHFPGNIRELEGMISDAVSRHTKGVLSTRTFHEKMNGRNLQGSPAAVTVSPRTSITFHGPMPTLKEMEKFLINKALETADGNQTIAARLLGISRKALNNRLIRASGGQPLY